MHDGEELADTRDPELRHTPSGDIHGDENRVKPRNVLVPAGIALDDLTVHPANTALLAGRVEYNGRARMYGNLTALRDMREVIQDDIRLEIPIREESGVEEA